MAVKSEMPVNKDYPPTNSILAPETIAWREEMFLDIGYSEEWAYFLSQCNLSYKDAQKLIAAGAGLLTAIRILAGTSPLGEDPAFDWSTYYGMLLDEGTELPPGISPMEDEEEIEEQRKSLLFDNLA